MNVVAVVPDRPQADYMQQALKGFAYGAIAIRSAVDTLEELATVYSFGVADRLSSEDAEPYPGWDDIRHYLRYEIAVSEMADESCNPPGFAWEEIRNGITMLKAALCNYGDADGLVIWNDKLWYNEVALEWARAKGVPYVVLERGCFPGTLIVDGLGLDYGNNSFRQVWDEYTVVRSDAIEVRNYIGNGTLEKQPDDGMLAYEISEMLPVHKPVVFVPLQVPIDTNVVFRGGGNKELIDFAAGSDEVVVVAKRHPVDYWTDDEWLHDYCASKGVWLLDADIKEIFPVAAGVLTQNSQVGIDALSIIHKVGVLGNAFWKHCGATIDDPQSVDEFVDAKQPARTAVERFLIAMRLYYLVPVEHAGKRIEEILSR